MDVSAIRADVERLQTELERLCHGHAEMQRKLREVRVSVTSADELVTVTVDARGQVERVELDPRIYQRPDSRGLAATITATIQQAAAESAAQVAEVARCYVPPEVFQAHLDGDLDRVVELRDAGLVVR